MKKAKRFYCRLTTTDDRYLWGYREALTEDLALSCFIQDQGIDEEGIRRSMSSPVDLVLVKRLAEFLPAWDPWGCEVPFTFSLVSEISDEEVKDLSGQTSYETLEDGSSDSRFHAARVRWLMTHPESLEDPISIDNVCEHGRVYPSPVILDGWHRFFAHCLLEKETIPVLYGGRLDLLRYLTGKRKTAPE